MVHFFSVPEESDVFKADSLGILKVVQMRYDKGV